MGTTTNNTFLNFADRVVQDSHDNFLTPTGTIQADSVVNDTAAPEISRFSLDMDNGQLNITFSEAVNNATFSATAITLQGAANLVTSSNKYQLTTGTTGVSFPSLTTVQIDLSSTDRDNIKAIAGLAKGLSSTFIAAPSSLVRDFSSIAFGGLTNSSGKQVGAYIRDSTLPTLVSFNFDINSASLLLTFTEPILFSSVNTSGLVLQDRASSPTASIALTGAGQPVAASNNSNIFNITLSAANLDGVQRLPAVAISNTTTFLRLNNFSLTDTAGNGITPVQSRATVFTKDTKAPTVANWSLDLNSDQLRITFSEVVNVLSLVPGRFRIENTRAKSAISYPLTKLPDAGNARIVTFQIRNDARQIKRNSSLATSRANTFLRIEVNGVTDMVGNGILNTSDTDNIQVGAYVADSDAGKLQDFDLHLFNNTLVLEFDDIMNPSTFDATQLTLHQFANGTGQSVKFTNATVVAASSTTNSEIITVNIGAVDAQAITNLTQLAISLASTHVSYTAGLIRSTQNVAISRLVPASAKKARSFTGDTGGPVLRAFTLNMNTGVLTLTFSEIIQQNSLVVSSLTLQNAAAATVSVKLSNGTLLTQAAGIISVRLLATDLNSIKANRAIGTSTTNTFITAAAGFASDALGQKALALTTALAASNLILDSTSPSVFNFTIDLNTGTLTLFLDEIVNVSTINITRLTLQHGAAINTTRSWTLQRGIVPTTNSNTVKVTLDLTDINELKRLNLCSNRSDCFISFPATFLQDTAGRAVKPVLNSNALAALNYTADSTPPVLSTFVFLDVDSGALQLSFNEPVLSQQSSINITGFCLQNLQANTSSFIPRSYCLTNSTVSSSGNQDTLSIALSETDLNGIKAERLLCIRPGSCFANLAAGFARDVAGQNSNATVMSTDDIRPDTTRPNLTSWSVDMDSGAFSLTFSEVIDDLLLNIPAITLQAAGNTAVIQLVLQGGTLQTNSPNTVMVFTIFNTALITLKANEQLFKFQNNSYIRFTSAMVKDMGATANNIFPRAADNALGASGYIDDSTRPTLLRFSRLDLNTGKLRLGFDEPMSLLGINYTGVTLQNSSTLPIRSYSLKGGVAVYVPGTINKTEIEVTMTDDDLRRVKLLTDLATTKADSFLIIQAGSFADLSGLSNKVTASLTGRNVEDFIADSVAPRLTNFTLDVDAGLLVISFDDVMNTSRIVPTLITLQSTALSTTNSVTLTGGTANTTLGNGYSISFHLSAQDLDSLKLKAGLGTDRTNSFLSTAAGYAFDVSGRPAGAVLADAALTAARVTPDSTPPRLVNFTINLGLNTFDLTFSEAVLNTSFKVRNLVLRSSSNLTLTSAVSYNLTGGSINISSDGRRLTIQLVEVDYSAIKRNSTLATSTAAANAFLQFANGTITDTAGNAIGNLSPLLATAIFNDTVAPRLTSYDLDVNGATGSLKLTFDEPVLASSINVSHLTLIDAKPTPASQVQLLSSSQTTVSNVVSVNISSGDLDRIKLARTLAISTTTVFLTVGANFVTDVAGIKAASIASGVATAPTSFVNDTTRPTLVSYDLDMRSGTLNLTFSEPILASSLKVAGSTITLQSSADIVSGTQLRPVANASITPATNGRILTLLLGSADTNAIKTISNLATSQRNSFLALRQDVLTDMAGNALVAVPSTNARAPRFFTSDSQPPVLRSFDMNMTSGVLTLSFSESINASSLNVSGVVFQSASTPLPAAGFVRLTGGFRSATNGASMTVTLSSTDLNKLKLNTNLFTSTANAFLFLEPRTVEDTTKTSILTSSAALRVSTFTNDTAPPKLLSYDLRMRNNMLPLELVLKFDEIVDISTFNASYVTLHANNGTGTPSVRLTGGSFSTTPNAAIIVLQVSTADLASIHRVPPLGNRKNTTYLSLSPGAVNDMVRLAVGNYSLVLVDSYSADLFQPKLSGFTIDLDGSGFLQLTYDEPITLSNFSVSSVTVTNCSSASGVTLPLTNSTAMNISGLSSQIRVNFSAYDLNLIKSNRALATSASTTCLTMPSGIVLDRAENPAQAITNNNQTTYIRDVTSPTVTRYDLNISSKLVTLQFSEAIDTSTFQPRFITIQNVKAEVPGQSVKLTGGILNSTDGTTLRFYLTDADRNSIQAMLQLAINRTTAYLSLTVDFIKDHAGNLVNRIRGIDALTPGVFTEDRLPPSLSGFSLSLNTNKLSLTFDEAVSLSTLDLSVFQLQNNATTPTIRYTLTTVFSATGARGVAEVTLSSADLSVIKLRGLCNGTSNCFASFPATFAQDASGRAIFPRTEGNAIRGNLTVDRVGPKLVSFEEINFINGTLTLSFDEPVDASTLTGSRITLQDFYESPPQQYNLTGGSAISADGATLVVNLTNVDLGGIKGMDNLCHKRGSCYITAGLGLVKDITGVDSQLLASGAPGLVVKRFIIDQTAPTLLRYSLDFNADKLNLTFSEPVRASDIVISSIALQLNATASSQNAYALTTSTAPSQDGISVVVISLSSTDSNALKSRSIGITNTSTYLTIAANTVRDMSFPTAQFLAAIANGSARNVNTYVADTTPPTVTFFTYNHDRDEIQLTFSEPVQRSTLNATLFTLHASDTSGTANRTLTGGNVSDATLVSLMATIRLSQNDIEHVKLSPTLLRGLASTYIAHQLSAVKDASGNPIAARTAFAASGFVSDASRPRLLGWQLDISSGNMNLTFSDVVRANTFDPTAFTVQDAKTSTNTVTLTIGTNVTNARDDGFVLGVTLSATDLFNIKSKSGLARTRDNAFLTVGANGVDDVYGVDVLGVTNGNAIQALQVFSDTTSPELSEFNLDMNTGTVYLSFTDTVNLTSFDQTKVSLQNSNSSSPSQNITLRGGTVTRSGVGRIIAIQLSASQFNLVASLTGLATSTSTSYVSLAASAVIDLSGNAILRSASAKAVTNFTADGNKPTLQSYSLDMDNGIVNLTFSETVHGLSLRATNLTFQHVSNSVSSALRYTLQDTGSIVAGNSTVVSLTMSSRDLNGIKSIGVLAKASTSTFLSFANGTVQDMASNLIDSLTVAQGQAVNASGYTADSRRPTLLNFSLDMDSVPAQLTLTFSEAVNASSLMATQLRILGSAAAGGQAFNLTGGTPSASNAAILTLTLTATDTYGIQKLNLTATMGSNTFITATENAIQDMFALKLTPVTTARLAQRLVVDTTPPTLVSFALNMNNGRLTLTFNEVIDLSRIDLTDFALLSNVSGSSKVNLTSQSSVLSTSNSHIFEVSIGLDLDSVKLETSLATRLNNTFLNMTAGAVRDMQGIVATSLTTPRNASGFTADTTAPTLESFTYDASLNRLSVLFSEPVNINSVTITRFTLLYNASDGLPDSARQTLTSTSVVSNRNNARRIGINIGAADSRSLQTKSELATGIGNTFLRLDTDAVRDMAANPIANIPATSAKQAASVSGDSSGPNMTSFTLDVDAGIITLTFSEAIDRNSFVTTFITIQNAATSGGENVTFSSNGTITRPSSTVISVQLSLADQNALKTASTLGFLTSNTYLIHSQGVINDFAQNPAPARTAGLRASNVTVDRTSPRFSSFSFDLNNAVLSLTFNEPVNMSTLNVRQLSLHNSRPLTAGYVSYTLNSTVTPSIISTMANFSVSNSDLNIIKRLPLCAREANCLISLLATAVRDVQGNNLTEVRSFDAVRATLVVRDTTAPTLNQFAVMDLDGAGLITLNFSETVLVANFSINVIDIQNWHGGAPLTTIRRLTNGTVTTTDDSIVSFIPSKADLDSIKASGSLCTSGPSCWIRFDSSLVQDNANNNVTAVVNSPTSRATEYALTLIPDTTAPELLTWALDMNTGGIRLTFNEPVDAAGVSPQTAILRNAATGSTTFFNLTGDINLNVGNTIIVTFTLRDTDLQSIKADSALCSGTSNCFVSFPATFARDTSGNNVLERNSSAALPLTTYTPDVAGPQLTQFAALDMDAGLMTLSFNEPVDASSINATLIRLVNASSGGISYNLTGALNITSSAEKTSITFSFNAGDLRGIKVNTGLATERGTSFISTVFGYIRDTSNNSAAARTTPLQASFHHNL